MTASQATRASGTLHITSTPSQNCSTTGARCSDGRWASVLACPAPGKRGRLPDGQAASPLELAHHQRDVLAAEAEAVAQGVPDGVLAGGVGHVVEVALGVGRLVVDR